MATLRMAELGFFGVRVITWMQTPRRKGEFSKAGVVVYRNIIMSELDLDFGPLLFIPSFCCKVMPLANWMGACEVTRNALRESIAADVLNEWDRGRRTGFEGVLVGVLQRKWTLAGMF